MPSLEAAIASLDLIVRIAVLRVALVITPARVVLVIVSLIMT